MERAKGWKYFCSVCYSCVGGWASFSSWHLLSPGWGNIQESSFSLTVILPSPNETRAVFWERGSKKSEGLKEEQDNSLFSFLPWITALLLCRAKTRERGKGSLLMPSDHLTSKNTKETRKVKHHPQRCRAAHAVLAEPFQSMQVFFRTICTGKCCQVFFPTHTTLWARQACTVIGCVTPQALRGLSSSIIQYGIGFCCAQCMSGKLTGVKTLSSPAAGESFLQ